MPAKPPSEGIVYTRDSNGIGWFIGIIMVLALLAIGYLVFSANRVSSTSASAVPTLQTGALVVAFDGTSAVYRNTDGVCVQRPLDTKAANTAVDCPPRVTLAMDAQHMLGAVLIKRLENSDLYRLRDGRCIEEVFGENAAYLEAYCP